MAAKEIRAKPNKNRRYNSPKDRTFLLEYELKKGSMKLQASKNYDGTSWTKVKCKFTKQRQSPGNDRDHVVIMKQTTINGHKTGITMHLRNKS